MQFHAVFAYADKCM